MLRLYWGLQGHGKTLGMIGDCVDKFRESPFQVYTNISELRFPQAIYFYDVEEISHIRDGLILLDETGIVMPAAYWQEAGRDLLVRLCQMRKRGLDMYYTCQRLTGTNVNLREQTNETVHCRKVGPWFFRSVEQPDTKAGRIGPPKRFNADIASLYNTYETIDRSGGDMGSVQPPPTSLAVLRRNDAKRKADAARPVKRSSLLYLDITRGYFGDPELLAPRPPVRRAYEWLRDGGHLDPARPWADQVREELARREWLDLFNLAPEDAPVDCLPSSPWLAGYDPVTVRARWQERHEEELAEKLVKLQSGRRRTY